MYAPSIRERGDFLDKGGKQNKGGEKFFSVDQRYVFL